VPVDVFGVVLAALAHTAIRSLVAGETPDRAAWAQATTAVLDALLAERASTNETLERIEAKLDSLRRDQFELPFKTGLSFLEQAQPPWREEEDRKLLLADARRSFVQAAAAAPDDHAALLADWYLALTWLLARSPEDCRRHLRVAAERGFAALVQAATWASDPPLDAVKKRAGTPDLSLVDRLLLARSAEGAATWALRSEALRYLLEARPLVAGVQRTRRRLGVAANESPLPRVAHGPDVATSGPEVVVDLAPGVNTVIGPLTIGLRDAVVGSAARGLHHVDCQLAVGLASGAPTHWWEVGLLDEPNADVRRTKTGQSLYVPLPSRLVAQRAAAAEVGSILDPLPGSAIAGQRLGGGQWVVLSGGEVKIGWLRVVSRGKPLAVEIRGNEFSPGAPVAGPFTTQPRFVMLAPIHASEHRS
jgi:hypothetical protein